MSSVNVSQPQNTTPASGIKFDSKTISVEG